MNTPANSPATLSAFKKRFPSNTMNTPPPSPCSAINKTPKPFPSATTAKTPKSSGVKKTNSKETAVPDIAKFHVSRPLTPSTCSETSERKFSFHVDKNQVEENCKKPSHARLGLNISSLNASFYDLSKALTNPKSTNTSIASITTEKTPPESFIATKKYKVPPRSSNNEYVVSFETVHKKGVVCSSDLDPTSKPIKKTEALMEKRKMLAQKLNLASRGASFSPISRVVKKEGSSFDSLPSTPTSAASLPDEDFKNVIQSGCVNDIMSKDIERTAQEGNQSVKDLIMNGYFLHSGRCVDLDALQQDIFTQILMEDANANVEELSSFFKLNVVLQLSYLPCTSYFNVPLERTCSMVGHLVKGLSIENDMKNVKAISDTLNEELALLETKIRDGDPNLVYSMKTSTFPTSTYIEKEEDLQTSIEKLGAVHGCIITCILRMKLNGISQKDLSKLPRCFRNADQYFLAKLICNDNLNRQFLSQGIWQLLSLELFESDVKESAKQQDTENEEITSYFDPEFEPADNLECFDPVEESPNSKSVQEETVEKKDEETSTPEAEVDISSHQREALIDENDEFSVENLEEEVETQVETKDDQTQTIEPILRQEETTQTEPIVEEPKTTAEATTETSEETIEESTNTEAKEQDPILLVSEPVEENREEEEETNEDNVSTDSSAIVDELPQEEEETVSEPAIEEHTEDESSQPQVFIQQTGHEIFNLQGQMVEVETSPQNQQAEKVDEPVEKQEEIVEEVKEEIPTQSEETAASSTSTSQIPEESVIEEKPSQQSTEEVAKSSVEEANTIEEVKTKEEEQVVVVEETAANKVESTPIEEEVKVEEPIKNEEPVTAENTKEQTETVEQSTPSTEVEEKKPIEEVPETKPSEANQEVIVEPTPEATPATTEQEEKKNELTETNQEKVTTVEPTPETVPSTEIATTTEKQEENKEEVPFTESSTTPEQKEMVEESKEAVPETTKPKVEEKKENSPQQPSKKNNNNRKNNKKKK